MKYFSCLLSVFYQIIVFRIDSKQKYGSVLYSICKIFFPLSPEPPPQKKSLKINQSQHHVIDSDNMLQTRNTYDL